MSVINFLEDIYSKKGEDFVKKLFNLNVTISEKICGSSFGFEYNKEFKFFKRTNGNALTKIDRVLMKFYEDPIVFFKKLNDNILKDIPENYRFMFEYFIDKKPNIVMYDKLPKNNLMLTHILDNSSSKQEIITDRKILDYWANIFEVSGPPIIFQGKLSDDAKDKIFQFLRMTKDEAIKYFNTASFTKFIITSVNPKIGTTILNDTIEKQIEGIIFSFDNGTEKINAKLIDPVILEIISKNKKNKVSDSLPIVFGDMIEFMELNRTVWEKYEFKKIDFYDRYLEIMSKLFLYFYKKNSEKYKDFSLATPDFLKKTAFDLNLNLIENINLIKLFEKEIKSKDIFKIFIALFRKKKKRIEEFLSPSAIKYQNKIVDDLLNTISKNNFKNESSIPLFSEFYDIINDDITIDINENYKNIDDLIIFESKKNINSIISFWQSAFSDYKVFEKNEKNKKIDIVIGKFQPINNKHIEFITELKKQNKNKIFIVQINNDNSNKNQPFNREISEKIFTEILENDNKRNISGYVIVQNNNVKKIIKNLSEKYTINSISLSEKYSEYIKKQIEYNIFEGSSYEIEILNWKEKQIDNINISSKNILETIINNDYKSFRKLCPKQIWKFFEQMRDEIKKCD